MREIKKKLAIVLALCLVITNVSPAFAAEALSPDVGGPEVVNEVAPDEVTSEDIEPASPAEAAYSDLDEEETTSSDAEYSDGLFIREATVDGITITLTADPGVFPEEAELSVETVEDEKTEEAIEEAVEKERDETASVASSYKFDIKMLVNGEEVQPDTSKGTVKVAFKLAEKVNDCLEVNAYHLKEDAKGELTAETLDTEVKTVEEAETENAVETADEDGVLPDGVIENDIKKKVTAIEAETDGFSYYVVEFTYDELQYVLPGDSSIKLSAILEALAIKGRVSEASVSNETLFTVEKDEDGEDWTVYALKTFNTEEWLKVTIDEVEYTIIVTDPIVKHGLEVYCDGAPAIEGTDYVWWDNGEYYELQLHKSGLTVTGNGEDESIFIDCDMYSPINLTLDNATVTGKCHYGGGDPSIVRCHGNSNEKDSLIIKGNVTISKLLWEQHDLNIIPGNSDSVLNLKGPMLLGSNIYSGYEFTISGNEGKTLTIQPNKDEDGYNSFRPIAIRSGNTLILEDGAVLKGSKLKDNGGGMVNVAKDAHFIMDGGSIEDCKVVSDSIDNYNVLRGRGGAIYVVEGGTFTMNGGIIKNCSATVAGGAIFSAGDVTINNGEITGCYVSGIKDNRADIVDDNIVKAKGGAVYLYAVYPHHERFEMTGGNIHGNTIGSSDTDDMRGAGVYAASGVNVKLGGKAIIEDNEDHDGTDDNLFLYDGVVVEIDKATESDMSIGVTTLTPPTKEESVKITTNGASTDTKYFTSDKTDYEVKYNTNEYLELAVAPHVHTFTYTANGGTITATCTAGCDEGYDKNPLTLTLMAPARLVYDGQSKGVKFTNDEVSRWMSAGLEPPDIIYYIKPSGQSEYKPMQGLPTDAGDYMAKITVEQKTAQVKFAIDKATPYIKSNPVPSDIVYGKKLADSTLSGGYAQVSSTDSTQVRGSFEWTKPDIMPDVTDSDITLYSVTFTPSDENNYNTVTCQVTITVIEQHLNGNSGSGSTSELFTGRPGNPVTNGTWNYYPSIDKWTYTTTRKFTSTWAFIANPYADNEAAWFYFDRNGNMLTGWHWLNWNGSKKCYYFNPKKDTKRGKCQLGGVTPDGYTVDETGAWTVNGVVQTR